MSTRANQSYTVNHKSRLQTKTMFSVVRLPIKKKRVNFSHRTNIRYKKTEYKAGKTGKS